ncbi:MAG: polyprenyl synthetase family protein [Bacteroidota bacterium]|nr:polyprenyl synthetase family protein [Bacteroidota bacterium]
MAVLDKIQAPIKNEMLHFDSIFKSSMKSNVPLLNIIVNYLLRRKGKQMRPMFVFLSAKLNGEVTDATYTAASLIELLHTATLVHDDVVDESYERRGFFSINALWKSKVAVLMGDYLLAKGLLLSVDHKAYDLLEIVSEAVREMSEGELLQIQRSRTLDITREQYFEIIRKKTATLIAACSASGAKSVGCDEETVNRMKMFGEYVGIAFQIKDDLFDYQTKGIIGKPTGNDIKEKKFTLPLIYALETSTKTERKHILRTISKHYKNSDKVKYVIDFVISKGGLEYASNMMYDYKNKAMNLLSVYPDSEVKSSLKEFVNYTIERNK